MARPAISVLMPVFNARRYVAEAIRSIQRQSFDQFQFIIVDDGSTDGSSNIIQSLARTDTRIRVIAGPNRGIVKALNNGLDFCDGEFIARMDADDLATPDRFQKQLAYLKGHDDCVAVGSRVLLIDDQGAPIREW